MKNIAFTLIHTLKQLSFLFMISICILKSAAADAPNIKYLETKLSYKAAGNKWKEAIVAADELLQYKPQHAEAHYEKGYALEHLGRYKEAIASFDLAIKYKYRHLGLVYYDKGNALKDLDMPEEALACYNKAIKLGYWDRWIYGFRDDVLMQLGRLGKDLDPI